MKHTTLLTGVLLLTACATQPTGMWYHPEIGRVNYAKDMQECEYEVNLATGNQDTLTIADAIRHGRKNGRLIRDCMKVRGYYWTQSEKIAKKSY